MDNSETGYEVVDWVRLVQGEVHWSTVMKTVMNLRRLVEFGEFLE